LGVGKPGLVVHAFAPIGAAPSDRDAAWAYLRAMWLACSRLGMDGHLIDSLAVDLPDSAPARDSASFILVAGRGRVAAERVSQAYAFTRHDVVGVCVAVASTAEEDELATWAALLREWREAGGDLAPGPQLLGRDVCFVADVDGPAEGVPGRLGDPVRTALRATGLDCWEPPFRTVDGFTLWEWQDTTAPRVYAAVSPREASDDLSRGLWWQGARELPPFARYLLNAAKLTYEGRVYDAFRGAVADRARSVDSHLDELLELHKRAGLASRTSTPRVQAAQQKLAEAQVDVADLAIDLTRLRSLERTVSIARHNLGLTAPQAAAGQPASAAQMFERDQALATWLESQVEQDIGYAEAVVARAREAQNVTQLRLQQALNQLTRAQSRVALIQTSLLAALLATFTVVNVLKVTIPDIDESQKVPIVAAFISLQLALPTLAAHWYERFGHADHLAAMLFGAAGGWLAAALIAGPRSPLLAVSVGIAVGVAAARALTVLHDRRLLAEATRDTEARARPT
jgi:hypothetical protein